MPNGSRTPPASTTRARGRPTVFDPAKADEILRLIVDEGKTRLGACAAAGVAYSTVGEWIVDNRRPEDSDPETTEGFGERYARARFAMMDRWADEVLTIADESPPSEYNHARLRVDSRKWLLSKLRPDQYGDHLQLGGPGGGPLEIRATVYLPDNGRDRPKASGG